MHEKMYNKFSVGITWILFNGPKANRNIQRNSPKVSSRGRAEGDFSIVSNHVISMGTHWGTELKNYDILRLYDILR